MATIAFRRGDVLTIRRTYIRDNRWHGRSPGFPLRFQRLGPL